MNKSWLFSPLAVAAAAVSPAQADILDVRFSGVVASQAGTSFSVGGAINGEFTYSTDTNAFLGFTIGGVSIAPGYASTALLTPDLFSAQYQAQLSPVQQGGTLNNTFAVDLEGLAPWPSANAVALLTSPGALATNLDTITNPNDIFPSTFGYFIGTSNGTGIQQVSADLTSIQVAVPEPATLALLAASCVSVGFLRRRRA